MDQAAQAVDKNGEVRKWACHEREDGVLGLTR